MRRIFLIVYLIVDACIDSIIAILIEITYRKTATVFIVAIVILLISCAKTNEQLVDPRYVVTSQKYLVGPSYAEVTARGIDAPHLDTIQFRYSTTYGSIQDTMHLSVIKSLRPLN